MRLKFKDLAADVAQQEIISAQISKFMLNSRFSEHDIHNLEERIRVALTGGTPPQNDAVARQRARVETDEWGKMYQYDIAKGHRIEDDIKKQQAISKKTTAEVLYCQMQEIERRKEEEKEADIRYGHEVAADVEKFHQEEQRKRDAVARNIEALKRERAEQLEDLKVRRELAAARIAKEDSDTAARIAFETKVEMEAEAEDRVRSNIALKNFLLQNEDNKVIRLAEKQRAAEEDIMYARLYKEQLDRQEQQREAQVQKLKAIQEQQAIIAASRPEAKTWIDPAIIDRHFREREEALAADEAKRKQRLVEINAKTVKDLDSQLEERVEKVKEVKEYEAEKAKELFARIKAEEEKEVARKKAVMQKRLQFKLDLEAQMRDNAVRKIIAPMSKTERLLNTKMLEKIADYKATGRIKTADLDGAR